MTLGNIFGGAMSPTSSTYYGQYPSSGESHQILSERDGSGYSYGFPKKSKWKYKSDKKHAAMSALTLLAFLFFLNILQNCLREQIQPISSEVTMMMMMPTPQKNIKDGPTHENDRGGKDGDSPWDGPVRRSRSLLQFKEETATKPNRHIKFIQDFREVNHNWSNGLSQLTEKELENQRLKTENLQSYLRRIRTSTTDGRRSPATVVPLARVPTTTHKSPFLRRVATNDWVPKVGPVYHANVTSRNLTKIRPVAVYKSTESRNRRSDLTSSGEQKVETVTPVAVGLDLNTYKTYPVYYNHRQRENATEATTPAPEVATTTTEHTPYTAKYPQRRYQPPRNRFRYASPNRYYQPRHPIESRFKYSPYRKASNYYDPNPGYHVHEEYYPVAVVRNPQEEDVGFDLIKFVWTMVSGFAKPLSKIVPFAKVGGDEPQCYDLLVCEAHRVSRLMGPTAEALASTFSTLLTWYTPEENRQVLLEAVSSGKENTCQQQILDCDERSGGKSAMTVLAQVLEVKLR